MTRGKPKKTIRGTKEFWNSFDEYWQSEGYDSRSDAVRNILEDAYEHGILPKDQVKIGFQMYASGISNNDHRLAETGAEFLEDVDDDLGEIARCYLDSLEE